MVMTPDTPSFTIPSIEATLAEAEHKRLAWSESQDELIQSVSHLAPRPSRTHVIPTQSAHSSICRTRRARLRTPTHPTRSLPQPPSKRSPSSCSSTPSGLRRTASPPRALVCWS